MIQTVKIIIVGKTGKTRESDVRFQVFTAASMKFRVFWDTAPYIQLKMDRRFRGAYCLHHQGDICSVLGDHPPPGSELRLTTVPSKPAFYS
jgi:hypothetical protein